MPDPEFVCQIAGLLIIIGAMILIFTRRIYLDPETKRPIDTSDIHLWGIARLQTNSSTLALVFLGVILLVYPVFHHGSNQTRYFTVEQEVAPDFQSQTEAYAVVDELKVAPKFRLRIKFPDLPDSSYQPLLVLYARGMCEPSEYPVSKTAASNGPVILARASLSNGKCPETIPKVQPETAQRPDGFKGIN